jgi:hypothetical protein
MALTKWRYTLSIYFVACFFPLQKRKRQLIHHLLMHHRNTAAKKKTEEKYQVRKIAPVRQCWTQQKMQQNTPAGEDESGGDESGGEEGPAGAEEESRGEEGPSEEVVPIEGGGAMEGGGEGTTERVLYPFWLTTPTSIAHYFSSIDFVRLQETAVVAQVEQVRAAVVVSQVAHHQQKVRQTTILLTPISIAEYFSSVFSLARLKVAQVPAVVVQVHRHHHRRRRVVPVAVVVVAAAHHHQPPRTLCHPIRNNNNREYWAWRPPP